MIDLPAQIKNDYGKLIAKRGIPIHSHNIYQKWLRFYLDFCHKYNYDSTNRGSLTHFIEKLNKKNKPPVAPQFVDEIYQDRRQSSQAQQVCYVSDGVSQRLISLPAYGMSSGGEVTVNKKIFTEILHESTVKN